MFKIIANAYMWLFWDTKSLMGKTITIKIIVVSTLTDQQFRPLSDDWEINAVWTKL